MSRFQKDLAMRSCSKTAEARDIVVTARMVNNQEMLDSLAIDYVDEIKNGFIAGLEWKEVSTKITLIMF